MLFNSYTFIAFFIIVISLHYLVKNWQVNKTVLLVASYMFYAAWNPPFVILLWVSTLADWFLARRIHVEDSKSRKKIFLAGSLIVNLGLLSFFKYGGFLVDNFSAFMALIGVNYQPAAPDIILPVGISFYTFQTLSYTIDIYKGKGKPWHSFLDYALYVTFFPQLVAGPIVRAFDFLPQCEKKKEFKSSNLSWGMYHFVIGLFLKIVVADGLLAPIAEQIYSNPAQPDTISAYAGTFAFAGQIFADFSGYSTCAIGIAMTLGFILPENFRYPYAAIGFSDFWRRWHISLSSWLRDYLYISMGGNRKGNVRTYINLSATMLLGGLWHGASWTFVVWGGLHGFYLIVERLLRKVIPAGKIWERKPVKVILALFTFWLVCITWVFFRADTFTHAFDIIESMFGLQNASMLSLRLKDLAISYFATIVILIIHWNMRDTSVRRVTEKMPAFLRIIILAAMLLAIVTLSGDDRAFIYFQF